MSSCDGSSPVGCVTEAHTILTELANGELKFDAIAIKPIESVDHDYIERLFGIAGALHHFLKRGPTIIGAGGTSLEKFIDDGPSVGHAMCRRDLTL
jgi:hypothetical protein